MPVFTFIANASLPDIAILQELELQQTPEVNQIIKGDGYYYRIISKVSNFPVDGRTEEILYAVEN